MPQSGAQADTFDVAIIGAGVVGCAMARRFVLDGARTIVLEKAKDILDGASKGNSGLLHTGFDAPVGSLEQRLIAEGYQEFRSLTDELGLPMLETGALVLAWTDEEAAELDALTARAKQNGVGVQRLSRCDIARREPHLSERVVAGFRVPGEHVIDPWTSPHAYLLEALLNGATLWRDAPVTAGEFDGEWHLATPQGEVRARTVINCAGLFGDHVDRALLGERLFEIRPRRGEFVVFDKPAFRLVRSILLAVPGRRSKGIVVCPTIYGNVLVGPTAEEQESRSEATVEEETLRRLHARAVAMVPALEGVGVNATYAGLRPASEQKDYRISVRPERRYASVGGIRSTGLSAALGIAQHVARALGEERKPLNDPVRPSVIPIAETATRDYARAGNGGIMCHCELVTKREILAAVDGPLGARTLAGLKRRTRATMGRCQGFHCTHAIATLLGDRLQETGWEAIPAARRPAVEAHQAPAGNAGEAPPKAAAREPA